MSSSSFSYQCACKQTTVTVNGTVMAAAYCHCSQCRKTCSAPTFHGAFFAQSDVKVEGPELGGYAINKMIRKFCKNCGTYVLGDPTPAGANYFVVPCSLIDPIGEPNSKDRPKAMFHIETGNCCLPAGLPDDGLTKYREQPSGPIDVVTKLAKQGPHSIAGATGVDCCDASPDSYSVVAQSAVGRVIKMTLKAGCSDNPHNHPLTHYLYILSGGKLKIDMPEGKSLELEVKAGMAMPVPGGPHQVSNVGDTDIDIIFLEPTGVTGETPEGHTPGFTTDPGCYKILMEDDDWFCAEMTMKAGAEDHPHSHRDHLLYVLEGDQICIYPGKTKDQKLQIPVGPGAALDVAQGWHTVANTGTKDIKIIWWEIKK